MVVDLSPPPPPGQSVNCGIPRDTYLGDSFTLRLPGCDASLDIIRFKDPHCHVFNMDLSRAYWQLSINPHDYHLLGYKHRGSLCFDVVPPFRLHSLAMMCQNTTSTIMFMFKSLGYSYTNNIDDLRGAETPDKSPQAFQALADLLHSLGLESSPDKDSPPSTSQVCWSILLT